MTSTIVTEVDAFVAAQNQNRGGALAGGGTLPLDYDVLTGSVPAGGNAVSGISGIPAGAAAIALPSGQTGNAVIIDGSISTVASTSGADSYSLLVGSSGTVTLTDNNTGNSQTITGAEYLVFDGGATTSTGAYQSIYMIETGTNAQIAAMYNAAFGRQPDLAGLEFYADPIASGALSLHQAATYFLASPEFAKLYPALSAPADDGGPNDQAFINDLYGQILHRTPTAAEVNYYVEALQGTLTTGSGAAIPAADRAQLLIYFSISPENQSDISSWLVNPANGAANFGALTTAAASTILTSELASGAIDASSFANMSTSAEVSIAGAAVIGGEIGAGTPNQQADPEIYVSASNVTVTLSSEYILGVVHGAGDIVNSAPSGGCIIDTASAYPDSTSVNNGGIVNLFGHYNWVVIGNPLYPASVATVVNGWDSTDILERWGDAAPGWANPTATLLANHAAMVLQASASSPIHGSTYAGTANNESPFADTQFAVNVGAVANDTAATMVAAANQVYKVGDIFTSSGALLENIIFFGQDPQGNTMVWYWQGDSSHAGTILASDIMGGVELVGVQASSLTSANFHH